MPSVQLLALWQLAEKITLSAEHHGETRVVVNRLCAVAERKGIAPRGLREAMQGIARHRNEIVHQGRHFYVDQMDLVLLRWLCEIFIDWLRVHEEALPTQLHLATYLEWMSVNNNKLIAIQETLGVISDERRAE